MFELNKIATAKPLNMCCGCLTLRDVHQMTEDEIKIYEICIKKFFSIRMAVFVCNLCAHMLKKFNKFVEQCQTAFNILSQAMEEDKKNELYTIVPMRHLCDLRKSNVQIAEFDDFKNVEDSDTENIYDHDIDVHEEDIPLVMLKTGNVTTVDKLVRKKKRKWNNSRKNGEAKENNDIVKMENNLINQEINKELASMTVEEIRKDIEFKTKEANSGKKTLKEGFTSRMVQETDEYTVIKLTNEQVLKEMEEKLRSEEYMRSLYKCEKCAKGFNFDDVLRSHMEKHIMKKGWLLCDLCQQYCRNIVSLRGHMKSHTTRYKCKVCGCVRLSRQVLLEHHSTCHTSDAVKYTCQQCDFVTSKRTSMQRHVRTRHHKTEKHPCDQCGKTFNSLEALRVHTTRHDKSKRVKCDECDRWFVYPSLLHQHKMAVHVRDDYYCVECDIKFKSRENLSLHFKRNKRHRDVTTFRYECEQCDKRFMFVSALSSHMAGTHGAGARHPCACGRAYSSRDALRAHRATKHGDMTCPCCKETFTRKSILRAHANERPFVCECGATFAQHSTLAAHEEAKHHKKEEIMRTPETQVSDEQNLNVYENSNKITKPRII